MEYAPIVIATLNRYDSLVRCIESLKRNLWAKYTDVFIGLDFPPSKKYQEGYDKILRYFNNNDFSQFSSITIIKREHYYGNGKNFSSLRDEVYKKYDRYIRVEDYTELSPNFIEYMDKCLMKYENDPNVIAVSGFSIPLDTKLSDKATVYKENYSVPILGTGFWKSKYKNLYDEINNDDEIIAFDEIISQRRYRKILEIPYTAYTPHTLFKYARKDSGR